MDINKNYNKNRRQINHKYDLLRKEIIEGIDLSKVMYEITGFGDQKRFGVTERDNIVCLDKDKNFRKLIQHIIDDVIIEPYQKPKQRVKERGDFDCVYNSKKTTNKTKKGTKTKTKYKKNYNLTPNFHKYFANNSYYDASNMNTYICSCGNKCVCNHCGGDCRCEFFHCTNECYNYRSSYCHCGYSSGEC
jgi:hypothetical protein